MSIIAIKALKVEKYIGQQVIGHNCNFDYIDTEMTRHILFGLTKDNKKVSITLFCKNGECGSGWTTASWGICEVKSVKRFEGYTHTLKNPISINLEESDEISNEVFKVSLNGGDDYYPSGWYNINMDLFTPNSRMMENRPTYIFTGKSGIGKSSLANKFQQDVKVFETDAYAELPDNIISDVIVLGNKYSYTLDDMKSRLKDTEIIVCSFN